MIKYKKLKVGLLYISCIRLDLFLTVLKLVYFFLFVLIHFTVQHNIFVFNFFLTTLNDIKVEFSQQSCVGCLINLPNFSY